MREPLHLKLSRREHQVMDAVYALGEATAHEVVEHLGEEEAYDSVRVNMANLRKEGLLERERGGREGATLRGAAPPPDLLQRVPLAGRPHLPGHDRGGAVGRGSGAHLLLDRGADRGDRRNVR